MSTQETSTPAATAPEKPRSAVIPQTKQVSLFNRVLGKLAVSLVLVATVVIWEWVVRATDIPNYLLPAPSTILDRFVDKPGLMVTSFLYTFWESLLGFVLAAVPGIFFAIVIARSALAERILYPYLNIIRVTPVIAIAPLLTIWFGTGVMPQVLVAALIAFFPIVVTTALGLKSVDPELLSLMRLLNASERRVLWKIRMPNALPYIFSSFRISAPLAVIGVLVGEFVGGSQGLGWLLITSRGRLDTATVFLMVVLAVILGLLSFAIVVAFEKRFVKWHPSVVLD